MARNIIKVKIKDLVKNYKDLKEEGVFGYNRKLNIRPKYQREFVYNPKQQEAVVKTVKDNLPLGIFYWAKNNDGTYEIIDGQQRTISLCRYALNGYAANKTFFKNMSKEKQNAFLDYEILVHVFEGTDEEKLNWFKTINTPPAVLTQQELRNAAYSGSWVTSAKKYFSKTGCTAFEKANKYLRGTPIRQDYLETSISWIADKQGKDILLYMAEHQFDENSDEIEKYFVKVIDWVKSKFTDYDPAMQGVDWGILYNKYEHSPLTPTQIQQEIEKLMNDDDVTNKKGVYYYIFDRNLKHLNIRSFPLSIKRIVLLKQGNKCARCNENIALKEAEADHITPWVEGGKTVEVNCQVLCKTCNRTKSNR